MEIYGPAIMNAEVISYKNEWEKVKTVGISQGREQEKQVAKETYPQLENFQDVTQRQQKYRSTGTNRFRLMTIFPMCL